MIYSVRFWPEQISAVTDSVPEQWQPDHTITNNYSIFTVITTNTNSLLTLLHNNPTSHSAGKSVLENSLFWTATNTIRHHCGISVIVELYTDVLLTYLCTYSTLNYVNARTMDLTTATTMLSPRASTCDYRVLITTMLFLSVFVISLFTRGSLLWWLSV